MANPGTELAALDFGSLIGGPLTAVITAQAMAAQSTASFIKDVGFYQKGQTNPDGEEIGGTPIYVDFKYPKEISPYQPAIAKVDAVAATASTPAVPAVSAVPAVPAVYQVMQFSVPILTMLPIPFIKVDIITIDFNAKITSMETQTRSADLSVGVDLQVKQRWPGGSAKLNVSVAYKKSTSSGASVERTYSMAIHVQASQDEMPAGMEKLLGILEGAMISKPAA
ncbi:Protein of unknown function [Flavobacterium micromati]|uniref:DUF2589 domain-containing protein n=1 Tax=Flavobacterium micromati TaxID=229205 RepID=A0A1M5PEN7_9FLAO|nr:DUF2589 domain-containing protein [Flavobacterium micromati]SHH00232.1 Protein of unknown function [Flavobacterium micromati]